MFASLIIIPPTTYTGGEVHVKHGSQTAILDVSKDSHINTSMLAWYTDVVHEVKPVSSGYRLALSYNLVHTSEGLIPRLPGTEATPSQLRTALNHWNTFTPPSNTKNMLVYCLKYQYTDDSMSSGVRMLKGEDAQMVARLRPLLEDLGFFAFFGELTYHVEGAGIEDPYFDDPYDDYYEPPPKKRQRCDAGEDDEDEDKGEDDEEDEDECDERTGNVDAYNEVLGVTEITNWDIHVKNLVDLDGKVVDLAEGEIELEDDQLIPPEFYKQREPDESEDSGFTGNVSRLLPTV
jgi:hypothetical protein